MLGTEDDEEVIPMLDDITANHLHVWLTSRVHEADREHVLMSILLLLVDYPDLPQTHSWTEIRHLAERY